MTLFEAIKERYSYRGEFKPNPVSREDLTKILEAGLAAPSGGNAQTTYLIGVDDPELIKSMSAILNKTSTVTAPAAVVVISHPKPVYKDMCFNIQDYSAAIENVLLAAVDLGYASCWIEGEITADPVRQKAYAELLGVPEGFNVVCFLPIGVPVSEGKRAVHRPFEERASFNRFTFTI
ncbi:MAG: nitroreductase family protein [Treponema sp.]|nr:nitroreductase family protein [Treponema sp.]